MGRRYVCTSVFVRSSEGCDGIWHRCTVVPTPQRVLTYRLVGTAEGVELPTHSGARPRFHSERIWGHEARLGGFANCFSLRPERSQISLKYSARRGVYRPTNNSRFNALPPPPRGSRSGCPHPVCLPPAVDSQRLHNFHCCARYYYSGIPKSNRTLNRFSNGRTSPPPPPPPSPSSCSFSPLSTNKKTRRDGGAVRACAP